MKKFIGLMALVTAASSVSATVVSDGFSYPTGNLSGNTNLSAPATTNGFSATNIWTLANNGGTATVEPLVTTGNLSYAGLPTSLGNSVLLTGSGSSGLTADRIAVPDYRANNTIYFSMTLEVPAGVTNFGGGGSGSFLTGFSYTPDSLTGTTTFNSGVQSSAAPISIHSAADGNGYNLGIAYRDAPGSSTRIFDNTDEFTAGQTLFLVGSYYIGPGMADDVASLYINPNLSTGVQPASATVVSANSASTGTNDFFYDATGIQLETTIRSFILRNNSVEPSHIQLDDLRIGSSWASVTPSQWTGASGSTWGSGGNWSNGVIPDTTDASVYFATVGDGTAPQSVVLASSRTVGSIYFDSANSYTISGTGLILTGTIANGGNPNAAITVQADNGIVGNPTISAPVQLNSGLSLTVPAGSTLTLSGPVTAASGFAMSLNGGGNASLKPASATALQGLTSFSISGASKLTLTAAHSTVTTAAFSIDATSTLDLTNNDLVVDYAPNAGNPTGTDTTTGPAVVAAVLTAYDNGLWDKAGITTSDALAGSGKTLAVVDNGSLATPLTSVGSGANMVAVDSTSVIVKYTWLGDLNLDGVVDNTDLGLMGVLNSTTSTPNWASGDLNYDGVINQDDVSLFQLGVAESGGANINSVPEPGAALALAGIGFIAVRRRRGISR